MNSENFDLHKKIEQQRKSLTNLVERIKKNQETTGMKISYPFQSTGI